MGSARRRSLPGLCVGLLLLFPGQPVRGEESGSEPVITWICWMTSERMFAINCIREQSLEMNPVESRQQPEFDTRQYLRDLFTPGEPRNLTRLVRANPAAYGNLVWQIPLWGPPFNMGDVILLARSVMCGRDVQCVVKFEPAGAVFPTTR